MWGVIHLFVNSSAVLIRSEPAAAMDAMFIAPMGVARHVPPSSPESSSPSLISAMPAFYNLPSGKLTILKTTIVTGKTLYFYGILWPFSIANS